MSFQNPTGSMSLADFTGANFTHTDFQSVKYMPHAEFRYSLQILGLKWKNLPIYKYKMLEMKKLHCFMLRLEIL